MNDMPILDALLPQRELDILQPALDALKRTVGLNGRILAKLTKRGRQQMGAIIEITLRDLHQGA